jgi:hypothetical protein
MKIAPDPLFLRPWGCGHTFYHKELMCLLQAGEFIELKDAVQWRDDQETLLSLAQIISVERANQIERYKVQLCMLIKVKDLPKGIPVPKIQPPHYRPNIEYPTNVAYTDYITTVDCHDIKGIIFVFTPNDIECSPAANCCGMDHAFTLQYGVLFGKSDRVVVSELLTCFHPTSCYSNRMLSSCLT